MHLFQLTILQKLISILGNNKNPLANAKGLEMSWLPRQDDFRNFCMSEETENICHKLEEVIGIC